MTDESPIVTALSQAELRLTDARRAVAQAVDEQQGHFTAEDVLDAAQRRRRGVGRATVFRSLELLTGLGLIERVDLPSGAHAYVACQPAVHHHHVLCSRCGRSVDVADIGLSPVIRRVESSTGYRIDAHRLELFGICPECRRETAGLARSARPPRSAQSGDG
jgi:Fur family ferric uptake transcriptional regulator